MDTNLLLLFFMGVFDLRYVSRFTRPSSYTEADFVALAQVVQTFERIIVTPHILTEVSNLYRHNLVLTDNQLLAEYLLCRGVDRVTSGDLRSANT